MVTQAHNLGTQEAEAGEWPQIQAQFGLYIKILSPKQTDRNYASALSSRNAIGECHVSGEAPGRLFVCLVPLFIPRPFPGLSPILTCTSCLHKPLPVWKQHGPSQA